MKYLKEVKNKYFLGQKVLYINTNNFGLKSKVCPDCDGFGKIYFKTGEKTSCKRCKNYGYIQIKYNDPEYHDLKYNKATVGVIKEIEVSNNGTIKYDIAPEQFHKKLIGLTPNEVLEYYDIAQPQEYSYNVDENDILHVYGTNEHHNYPIKNPNKQHVQEVIYVSSIENHQCEFNDLFSVGENIFYVEKNVSREKKESCHHCNGTKTLETVNGSKVDCPYCKVPTRELVDLLMYGKIIAIKYRIYFFKEEDRYSGELRTQKIFEILVNNTYNSNGKPSRYDVPIYENKILNVVKTIDEAIIQLGDEVFPK